MDVFEWVFGRLRILFNHTDVTPTQGKIIEEHTVLHKEAIHAYHGIKRWGCKHPITASYWEAIIIVVILIYEIMMVYPSPGVIPVATKV